MDTADRYELAMFPLGMVLFPSSVLPLHVFEPRYRAMVEHLIGSAGPDGGAAGAEFGVVLIERGSEVGGGDARTEVGTVAGIVQAEQFDDGRWGLVAVGLRRCRVIEWLDDDPWPRALVTDWPDARSPSDEPLDTPFAAALAEMRRLLALASELGDRSADATSDLSDDPELGSFQLAAIGPFGPADQQRLLELDSAGERITAVLALVEDQRELLEHRLRLDAEDDDLPDLG